MLIEGTSCIESGKEFPAVSNSKDWPSDGDNLSWCIHGLSQRARWVYGIYWIGGVILLFKIVLTRAALWEYISTSITRPYPPFPVRINMLFCIRQWMLDNIFTLRTKTSGCCDMWLDRKILRISWTDHVRNTHWGTAQSGDTYRPFENHTSETIAVPIQTTESRVSVAPSKRTKMARQNVHISVTKYHHFKPPPYSRTPECIFFYYLVRVIGIFN